MQNNSENAISDLDCDCAPLYNEDEILGSMTIINFGIFPIKKKSVKQIFYLQLLNCVLLKENINIVVYQALRRLFGKQLLILSFSN